MMIPVIVTLLFIIIVRFVGAYFICKADEKWEQNLKRYIDQKMSQNNENNENKKVEANATTFKRD